MYKSVCLYSWNQFVLLNIPINHRLRSQKIYILYSELSFLLLLHKSMETPPYNSRLEPLCRLSDQAQPHTLDRVESESLTSIQTLSATLAKERFCIMLSTTLVTIVVFSI